MADPSLPPQAKPPGVPGWVKVSALAAVVVIAVVVIVMLLSGGEHGPGRHVPGNGGGDHAPMEHDS